MVALFKVLNSCHDLFIGGILAGSLQLLSQLSQLSSMGRIVIHHIAHQRVELRHGCTMGMLMVMMVLVVVVVMLVGMPLLVEMLMGMGMLVIVLMAVVMLMGVSVTVVGVLMGMGMEVAVHVFHSEVLSLSIVCSSESAAIFTA